MDSGQQTVDNRQMAIDSEEFQYTVGCVEKKRLAKNFYMPYVVDCRNLLTFTRHMFLDTPVQLFRSVLSSYFGEISAKQIFLPTRLAEIQ